MQELIALADGYRESAESWADLLRDCARRGMRAPVLAMGDGALGFWNGLREVFPRDPGGPVLVPQDRQRAGRGMTAFALRPATRADIEFCYQLHKAAMGSYITAIWGWDEKVQRDLHARGFNPSRWQIITADDTDIGMLDVEHRPPDSKSVSKAARKWRRGPGRRRPVRE